MFRTNVGPMRGGMAPAPIKGTPLLVNGVLYLTLPDHVWALNAYTGEEFGTTVGSITVATYWAIVAWACTVTGCTSLRPMAGSFH